MKNLLVLRPEKLEELPNREHRNRRTRWNRFWDQYPSNKVHRFLQSNVGQLWNDVFHKYCNLEWIPHYLRNLEHIKRDVIIDTFLKDGKVFYIPLYRSAEEPVDQANIGGGRKRFYVHPQTKKLCVVDLGEKRAKDQKNRVSSKLKTMRILGDYHQLLKQDGLWCEVKAEPIKLGHGLVQIGGLWFKEANVKPVERWVNGILLKDIAPADGVKYTIHNGKLYLPTNAPCRWSGGRHPLGPRERIMAEETNLPRYLRGRDVDPHSFKIVLRRQLNSKELKRYGLKNDPVQYTQRCKKCGGLVGKDCLYHYCAVCEKPNDDCICQRW